MYLAGVYGVRGPRAAAASDLARNVLAGILPFFMQPSKNGLLAPFHGMELTIGQCTQDWTLTGPWHFSAGSLLWASLFKL